MANRSTAVVREQAMIALSQEFDRDFMLTAYDQLKPTERIFVDAFVATDSPTNAIKAAMPTLEPRLYSIRSVDMLRRPLVQAAIADRIKAVTSKYEVTLDRTVKEIAKMGYANVEDYINVDEDGLPTIDLTKADRDQMAALAGFEVKELKSGKIVITPKMHDKNSALDKLMKYLGGYAPVGVQLDARVLHASADNGAVTEDMTEADAADYYARSLEQDE